ncbi:MAG: (Fe-S)-binding protein [Chloroflexota bacterium]
MEAFLNEVGGWAAAQLDACTRCGICAAACPFYAATKDPQTTPIWKLDLLRRAYEQRSTLLGKLKLRLGLEKPIQAEDLEHWRDLNFSACSTCNRCSVTCPMGIAVGPLLHELRDRLADAGAVPENLKRMRSTLLKNDNVFGFPSDERAGWVDYMDEPPDDLYQRPKAEVVYFVGCVSSFAPRAQRIAEAFVHILDSAGVNFTILGGAEACCGFPLRSAGMLHDAEALIRKNVAAVWASGAKTVVFTCPACRLMWLEEYRARLPGVRLLHSSELMAELIEQGQLALKEFPTSITYHDPCDLARTGGVFDAPRAVLGAIPGVELREVDERRQSGLCCGGGGDVEMVNPAGVKQVGLATAEKLSRPGAAFLATACPQCTRVLEEGMKKARPEMKVLDITEIVARSLDTAG